MSKLSGRVELPIKDICKYKHIKKPWATYFLFATLVAVFLYEILFLGKDAQLFMLNWNLVLAGEWYRLITHIFLHANIFIWFIPVHLVSNLYFLWIFSDNAEDWFARDKRLRFAYPGIFILWGVIAGAIFGMSQPEAYCLGASGAISGVLGFYFVMYPYAQINVLSLKVIPVHRWEDLEKIWESKKLYPVSAFHYLWAWFAIQVLLWWQGSNECIAYLAHVGGFVAGLGTAFVCKKLAGEDISSEFLKKLKESVMDLIKKLIKRKESK